MIYSSIFLLILQGGIRTPSESYLSSLSKAAPVSSSSSSPPLTPSNPPRSTSPPPRLSGEQIDKYVLCQDPNESTSGKSKIYEAYVQCPQSGTLADNPVVVKVSPNTIALEREALNYDRIAAENNKCFVQKLDYFPSIEKSWSRKDSQSTTRQSAIVLEKGSQDLRQFLKSQGPLRGEPLQKAAIAAAQVVQAVHEADMVWTEIKTENFVVNPESPPPGSSLEWSDTTVWRQRRRPEDTVIKGIDLESAVPLAGKPIDYSPEAVPPEFATALLCGREPYMEMLPSFDVWSYGMVLYEMAHGTPFFPQRDQHFDIVQYLRTAQSHDTLPTSRAIDPEINEIIQSCLRVDANRRPTMAQVLNRLQ